MERSKQACVPPDGGYGWVIVIVFILINSCLLPLTQCFGVIYTERYYSMLDLTAAKVSFLLHLNSFIMYALGILCGPLFKKFNCRQVSQLGSGLVCTGIFLTSFVHSYEVLIVTIGILIGAGQAILMPGMYIAVNTYFKKRLTLAISMQVTGASLSQIFMPHVCHHLMQAYGLHGTVLILSAIAFNAMPLTFLLRPIGEKRQKRCHDDAQHVSDHLLGRAVYQATTYRKQSRWREFIKTMDFALFGDRAYVIIVLGMGISFAAELNVILMMPFMLAELAHFDSKRVASALSVQAAADIVGRLIVPLCAHRIDAPPKLMYLLSLAIACLSRTVLCAWYNRTSVIYLVLALLGLAKGIKAVYQSIILPTVVSFEQLPAATGLSMLCYGILSLIIGPLIGWTHDLSGSYIYTLHTASAISLLCMCMWIGEFVFSAKCVHKSAMATNPLDAS